MPARLQALAVPRAPPRPSNQNCQAQDLQRRLEAANRRLLAEAPLFAIS